MNPERRELHEKLIETVRLPSNVAEAPDFILKELVKRKFLTEGENPGHKILFRVFDKKLLSTAVSRGVDRNSGSQIHYGAKKALEEAGLKPGEIAYAGIFNNIIKENNSSFPENIKQEPPP